MAVRWRPLESNPDVMNTFLRDLGLGEPWGMTDIISLDPDTTDLVAQPCLAVILLLPITDKYNEFTRQQEIDSNEIDPVLKLNAAEPYFMKQTIHNACGTIALIHAIANNIERLEVLPDSVLGKFLESTRQLSPVDRGRKLEENVDIANLHEVGAHEGQSETPGADDDVDLHFIALVNYGDHVVELDGRKNKPIVHAVTNNESFVKDAFKVAQKYMSIDPFNLRFSALSLGPVGLQ